MPIPDSLPEEQVAYYTAYYRDHSLPRRLAKAVDFVRENRHLSAALDRNMTTLLQYLERSHARSDLHQIGLELILELNPIPLHLGYWELWEQEIRFAHTLSLQQGRIQDIAVTLDCLLMVLYYTGQHDELKRTLPEVYRLMESPECPPHLVIGIASTVVGMLIYELDAHYTNDFFDKLISSIQQRNLSPETHPDLYARLHILRSSVLRKNGESLDLIFHETEQAVKLVESHPQPVELAGDAYRIRALINWVRGEAALAVVDYKKALSLFEQSNNIFSTALTTGNLGLAYWSLGDLKQAVEAKEKGIEIAKNLRAYWQWAREVGDLAVIFLTQGDLEAALRCIERQIKLSTRVGQEAEILRAAGHRAIVNFHQGLYEQARVDLEMEITEETKEDRPEGVNVGCARATLSLCYLFLGQPEKALREAERSIAIGRRIHVRPLELIGLRALAECLPKAERAAVFHEALAVARQTRRIGDEAACLISLSHLASEPEEGRALWQTGLDLLTQMGAVGWLTQLRTLPAGTHFILPLMI